MTCNIDLSKYTYNSKKPFDNMCGMSIVPNQTFTCTLDNKLLQSLNEKITFDIEYKSNKKIYQSNFVLDFKVHSALVQTKASTDGKELKIISYTLQDIAEKLL